MKLLRGQLEAQGIDDILPLEVWSDEEIKPGHLWRDEIRKALDASIAAVLLVDNDFMTSRFIQDTELPGLLNSARIRGKGIFPVCVGHTGTVLRGGGDLRALQFMCGTLATPLEALASKMLSKKLYEIARCIREDLSWTLGERNTPSAAPAPVVVQESKVKSSKTGKDSSKTRLNKGKPRRDREIP